MIRWLPLLLLLGCARTSPLCHDGSCSGVVSSDGSTRPTSPDGGFVVQRTYVKAQNTEAGDAFGSSLALSGDGSTLAVGAPGEDSRAAGNPFDNSASASGAVYVFIRREGTWSQQAYLKADRPRQGDHFGHRVALSRDGHTLAVSAVDESSDAVGVGQPTNNNLAPSSGAVFLFTRSNGAWSPSSFIKASNTGARDTFGAGLALAGDGALLLVGAPGEASDATGVDGDQLNDRDPGSGAAYVFRRVMGRWSQTQYRKPNVRVPVGFGSSVASSGDGVHFGFTSNVDAGVIEFHTSTDAEFVLGQSGAQGTAVALDADGSRAAFSEDVALNGVVRVLVRAPRLRLESSVQGQGVGFGASLSLDAEGSLLAIGHTGDASRAVGTDGDALDTSKPNAGAVRLYRREGASRVQHAYVKPLNTGAGDLFGTSVALSLDGTSLVVGAPGEASHAIGINGNAFNDSAPNAGAVYVFTVSR